MSAPWLLECGDTMRLYPGKVDTIAAEIVTTLAAAGDIEVTDNNEAQLDAAAVLKEYIRVDKELTERAKDILEIRGLPYSHLGRTKRQLAPWVERGATYAASLPPKVARRRRTDA